MVPRDLNIGFQGLALIQGQIYNPVTVDLVAFLKKYHCKMARSNFSLESSQKHGSKGSPFPDHLDV